uniref:Uncharacterized protein n=1 Tax=Burkholderia sp. M701 TaxID=326454 RepID=V5YNU8_9BURK|nr:hypothetical protein [Burkholderia sp. M701]
MRPAIFFWRRHSAVGLEHLRATVGEVRSPSRAEREALLLELPDLLKEVRSNGSHRRIHVAITTINAGAFEVRRIELHTPDRNRAAVAGYRHHRAHLAEARVRCLKRIERCMISEVMSLVAERPPGSEGFAAEPKDVIKGRGPELLVAEPVCAQCALESGGNGEAIRFQPAGGRAPVIEKMLAGNVVVEAIGVFVAENEDRSRRQLCCIKRGLAT